MSNLKFYLLYLLTAFFASLIAVGIFLSTEWPNRSENGTEFDANFDDFWRDDQGRAPIYIASHFSMVS